jgi:hypothetical protein
MFECTYSSTHHQAHCHSSSCSLCTFPIGTNPLSLVRSTRATADDCPCPRCQNGDDSYDGKASTSLTCSKVRDSSRQRPFRSLVATVEIHKVSRNSVGRTTCPLVAPDLLCIPHTHLIFPFSRSFCLFDSGPACSPAPVYTEP